MEHSWEENGDNISRIKELFTSNRSKEWNSILDCVDPVVTEEKNRELIRPITAGEIKEAAF